jgi:transposase
VLRYSEAVQADIKKRMSPPSRQSVAMISQETGTHIATLYAWRKGWRLEGEVVPASQDANQTPVLTLGEQRGLEKLRAQDQREIKRLQKELRNKEKALAEAAALLLVTNRMQALSGEAEEGRTES